MFKRISSTVLSHQHPLHSPLRASIPHRLAAPIVQPPALLVPVPQKRQCPTITETPIVDPPINRPNPGMLGRLMRRAGAAVSSAVAVVGAALVVSTTTGSPIAALSYLAAELIFCGVYAAKARRLQSTRGQRPRGHNPVAALESLLSQVCHGACAHNHCLRMCFLTPWMRLLSAIASVVL